MWEPKDRAVHFQPAEPLRRNFRDARLVTLEGVGHLPYEEAPEDFNRALVDFLIGAPSAQFPVQLSVKPPLLRPEKLRTENSELVSSIHVPPDFSFAPRIPLHL